MKTIIRASFVFVVFVIVSVGLFAQEAILKNADVIALTNANVSEAIIINKIRSSKITRFQFTTEALIELKNAGVSDKIVVVMQNSESDNVFRDATRGGPPNSRNYGIFLGTGATRIQLKPNVSATSRQGGFLTNRLTYGIGKRKTKAKLPNKNADLQIDTSNPVFYFHLDENSGGLNTSNGIPSTTKEFILVKFHVKKKRREITIAKQNAFGQKGGLSKEYILDFKTKSLGNGVFQVTPAEPLKPGEYAFYLINSGTSNAGVAMGIKFFDFGVNPVP